MEIAELIRKRKSCRAFEARPVDPAWIHSILEAARWAPSGVNHQPAKVAVLGKETRAELSRALIEKFNAGTAPNPDYEFCPPSWSGVYQSRRKECGSALYRSLGVAIDDAAGKKKHKSRNYDFFGAPAALIVSIERGMPKGSWMDLGFFIQNILLAAESLGLASCPQASLAEYPDTVREILSLPHDDIVCGIALGFEDRSHPLNSYRTERQPVESFTQWYR